MGGGAALRGLPAGRGARRAGRRAVLPGVCGGAGGGAGGGHRAARADQAALPGGVRDLQRRHQAGRAGILLEPDQHLQGPAPGADRPPGPQHRADVGLLPGQLRGAGGGAVRLRRRLRRGGCLHHALRHRRGGPDQLLPHRPAARHLAAGPGAHAGLVPAAAAGHVGGHPAARPAAGRHQPGGRRGGPRPRRGRRLPQPAAPGGPAGPQRLFKPVFRAAEQTVCHPVPAHQPGRHHPGRPQRRVQRHHHALHGPRGHLLAQVRLRRRRRQAGRAAGLAAGPGRRRPAAPVRDPAGGRPNPAAAGTTWPTPPRR